jgi:hypothetical protein
MRNTIAEKYIIAEKYKKIYRRVVRRRRKSSHRRFLIIFRLQIIFKRLLSIVGRK